mgnify:CR=1 FL=1
MTERSISTNLINRDSIGIERTEQNHEKAE